MVSALFLIFSVFGMILSSKRKNPAIVREFFENSSFGATVGNVQALGANHIAAFSPKPHG